MNERIRELAEQARLWAEVSYKKQNDQFTSHWDTPIGYTVSQFFEQKFAELIVRECMEQVFYTIEDQEQDNISGSIRDRIKEHFGVEE
jgi:hypothetical protein